MSPRTARANRHRRNEAEASAPPAAAPRTGRRAPARAALPSVNLLPAWAFERMAVRRLRLRFTAAAVVLLVLVAGAWSFQTLRVGEAQRLLAVEQGETARLTAENAELAPVKAYIDGVAHQKALVSETMAREIIYSDLLEALQDAAPAGVQVDSVIVTPSAAPSVTTPPASGTDGAAAPAPPPTTPAEESACPGPDPFDTLTVVGCVTLAGSASSRGEVGDFVIALGRDPLFVEPFISTTTTSDAAKVTFAGSVGLSEKALSRRYVKIDRILEAEVSR